MKLSVYLFSLLFVLTAFSACDDEDLLPSLNEVAAPSDLGLDFDIANDNSGEVTILPSGRGVTLYRVNFGDGSGDVEEVNPGEYITHTYPQGSYTVTLEAMGINGETTTYSEELTVDFAAPENLVVTITRSAGNPFSIDVTATADLETGFLVYFGDEEDEEPVSFSEGEVVQHVYDEVGEYMVRVVAVSGGTETVEETTTVVISNPLLLPIDFENPNLSYEFISFGGANLAVVDNPDRSEVNNSSRVAEFMKQEGAETYAGTILELGEPLDFSSLQKIRVKTWSPKSGITVLLKLENATNGDIFAEVPLTTSVANGWEELVFDFSGADLSQEYSKVVIFFDFGETGDGATYYFDQIELTDGSGEVALPLNFEATDVEFTFTGFGSTGAEVIDNPDASGINTSDRVVAVTKAFGSETYGGAFIDLSGPIDFSSSQQAVLKVWSPKVGAQILLKFENPDSPETAVEVMVPTTVANAWEELTFDFSGIDGANNYSRVVLFGDFGVAGTGEAYYFDDLRLTN